jgi:hypothetical protein
MRFVIVVAVSAALNVSAFAQSAGTGSSTPTPPANSQSSNNTTSDKFAKFRKEARDQNLGVDEHYYVRLCIQEARLNCLKQALVQRKRGYGHTEFMKRCMG